MVSEKPAMSKEAFWKNQMEDTTKGFYGRCEYPHNLYEELRKIKAYCVAQQIELIFIIPPTHVDLEKQVWVYGLEDAYQKYKADLKSIAPVLILIRRTNGQRIKHYLMIRIMAGMK